MSKQIPLTQGKFSIVDDEDYDFLIQRKWRILSPKKQHHTTYARGVLWRNGKRISDDQMHRLIMNAPCHLEVDHIDGNGLNNQKSNLRLVTRSQQLMNTRLSQKNKSGVRGVSWSEGRERWVAMIQFQGKTIPLGRFKNKEDAISARKMAEEKYFGEFAKAA